MTDPNELDDELTALFSRRLEQNRRDVDGVAVQLDIIEKTGEAKPGWQWPALVAAAGCVALIVGFIALRGDSDPSTEIDDVADDSDPPTLTESPDDDAEPGPSSDPEDAVTAPFDNIDVGVSRQGEVVAGLRTGELEVLWTPEFEVDESLLPADPATFAHPDVYRSNQGLWFRLVPADRRFLCDTGAVYRFDYQTGAVEQVRFADSIAGPLAFNGLVAAAFVNVPELRNHCGAGGVELYDTASAGVVAQFASRDGEPGVFVGADHLTWSVDADRFAFDGSEGLGESRAALFDTSDPTQPTEIVLERGAALAADWEGGVWNEHVAEFTGSAELIVVFEELGADPAVDHPRNRWASDGSYIGPVSPPDDAWIDPPEMTVENERIGPLSLPATDAEVRAAFPENEGWTVTPAVLGDGVPGLRIAYRGVDQAELSASSFERPDEYDVGTVQGRNFTDSVGVRIGDSLDSIAERFGHVLVRQGELHDVSIRNGGLDQWIGYHAGNRDASVVPFVEGADSFRSSAVWSPGSFVSEFFVLGGGPMDNIPQWEEPEDLHYVETCGPAEDITPGSNPWSDPDWPGDTILFEATEIGDLDLDGRADRLILMRCRYGAGERGHAFIQLTFDPLGVFPRQAILIAEGYAAASVEDAVLTIVEPVYAEGEPSCCPTREATVTYLWMGEGFEQTSRVVEARPGS